MATDASGGVSWLLEVPATDTNAIAGLRHWRRLEIARSGDSIWITGFDHAALQSLDVKGIPAKRIWRKEASLLFEGENLVPEKQAPSLTWTPIARGLPLSLPAWNHAHTMLEGAVRPRLVRENAEHESAAILVPLETLADYITDAPAIRLAPLHWTILPPGRALIIGTPLLPLPGDAYWAAGGFLIPAGLCFEFPELRDLLGERLAEQHSGSVILMAEDGSWSAIPRTAFGPLSIGSFRQSNLLMPQKASDAR